jgi:hypothetical protein
MNKIGERADVSVIIVSYNTKTYLRECLTSFFDDPSPLVREVIVVDNASSDGSTEMVKTDFPGVTLIANPSNLGYAKAVNRGIEKAGGRYLLILNPDVEVNPESIRGLRSFMERTPDAGITGGKLLNPDGTLQMSCRTFYTIQIVLLRRTFLGWLFPRSRLIREHLMLDWDHNSDREVDWVIGACMMVRREAYENVGGMDERFFLYLEDVDWCYRMKKHGWKVHYVHSGSMKHHHRRESARLLPDKRLMSHLLSTLRFYDKWGSVIYALKRERRILSLIAAIGIDLVFINLSFLLAYYFRILLHPLFTKPVYPVATYRSFMIFVNIVCLLSFAFSGLYRRSRHEGFARDLIGTSRALFISGLVIMASTYLTRTVAYSRLVVLVFWPISTILVTAGRALQRGVRNRLRKGLFDLRRVLVVGEDESAVSLKESMASAGDHGLDFVGYVVPAGREGRKRGCRAPSENPLSTYPA